MMTRDEALAWARMVAPRRAAEVDVQRIAVALLEAERRPVAQALEGVATVLDALARSLRAAASLAREGRPHGARVSGDDGWQKGPGENGEHHDDR